MLILWVELLKSVPLGKNISDFKNITDLKGFLLPRKMKVRWVFKCNALTYLKMGKELKKTPLIFLQG